MVWSIEVVLKCIQASPAQLASSDVEGKNEGREEEGRMRIYD